jgi:hypothetical protein
VNFLTKEFDGLPDTIVQAVLSQLERAIRDATLQGPTSQDLSFVEICVRIKACLEFARLFKRELGNTEDQSTN